MIDVLWAAFGALIGGPLLTVLADMASQEIRDRLNHIPHAILRLASRRLTPEQHITIYEDEWLPELTWILRGHETRPITRLITGTTYAIGILTKTAAIARRLNRTPPAESIPPPNPIHRNGGTVNVKGHWRRRSWGRTRWVPAYRRLPGSDGAIPLDTQQRRRAAEWN